MVAIQYLAWCLEQSTCFIKYYYCCFQQCPNQSPATGYLLLSTNIICLYYFYIYDTLSLAEGVAQMVMCLPSKCKQGPEFKPQYHKEKRNIYIYIYIYVVFFFLNHRKFQKTWGKSDSVWPWKRSLGVVPFSLFSKFFHLGEMIIHVLFVSAVFPKHLSIS
jgi:hypothetical protein